MAEAEAKAYVLPKDCVQTKGLPCPLTFELLGRCTAVEVRDVQVLIWSRDSACLNRLGGRVWHLRAPLQLSFFSHTHASPLLPLPAQPAPVRLYLDSPFG